MTTVRYSIGRVAELTGLSPDTLRWHERIGAMVRYAEPPWSPSHAGLSVRVTRT